MKNKILIITLLLLSRFTLQAKITLPSVFSDNMVLQQNSKVAIWGEADAGQSIQIKTSWKNDIYTLKADDNGNWKADLSTPVAGGPYTIEITNKVGEKTIIKDILIGEVWICSGQSNMEVPVKNVDNAEKEIKDSDYPKIRFFKVPHKSSIIPVKDIEANWQSPTPETVETYSSVAFFFARNLYKHLKVPIGIIHSSYGASNQEAWLSEENIAGVTYAEKLLSDAKAGTLESTVKEQKIPTGLYNAMIKPLIPFTIKGVCWYQGEGNAFYPNEYQFLLNNMITSWRKDFKQPELPFILVQLAGFKTQNKNGWIKVQESQYQASLTNKAVATVMTYDIGDSTNIHPKNKQDAALRMELAARKIAYGEDIIAQGPEMKCFEIKKEKFIITFKNTGKGLIIKNDSGKINNFMLAGEDKIYYPAETVLVKDNEVEVTCNKVAKPMYVRYAFSCFNPNINFYNLTIRWLY